MKTKIPKGTKFDDMDEKEAPLYDALYWLEEELMDFSRTVQECIHYTEKNGLNYTITADLEDIESFITIVRRQSSRFYNEVTWGIGDE